MGPSGGAPESALRSPSGGVPAVGRCTSGQWACTGRPTRSYTQPSARGADKVSGRPVDGPALAHQPRMSRRWRVEYVRLGLGLCAHAIASPPMSVPATGLELARARESQAVPVCVLWRDMHTALRRFERYVYTTLFGWMVTYCMSVYPGSHAHTTRQVMRVSDPLLLCVHNSRFRHWDHSVQGLVWTAIL